MTTITLPLALWGTGYDQFIHRWLEGVRSLRRQPDEIVVVTDEKNKHIKEFLNLDIYTQFHWLPCSDYRLWDYAIRQSHSKWFAICNIDDYFLPGALDEIDQADAQGCNLLIDSLEVSIGGVWSGYWDADEIPFRFTMPGAEPMTRELYVKAGGFDHNLQFPDWGLAVHMVHKNLAKPYKAQTRRIMFDTGHHRVTLSGQSQDPSVKAAGTAQIHELSRSLGLL